MSSTPSVAMPGRHAGSRNHSHSISLGTNNPTHRVTRRKSMTGTAAVNMAAMAAALRGQDGDSMSNLTNASRRMSSGKFGKAARTAGSPSSSMPHNGNVDSRGAVGYRETEGNMEDEDDDFVGESAVTEGYVPVGTSTGTKNRLRRASEGAHLAKDNKRVSGELRCEKCGKGYKHSSCLTKHLLVYLGSSVLHSSTPFHIFYKPPLTAANYPLFVSYHCITLRNIKPFKRALLTQLV